QHVPTIECDKLKWNNHLLRTLSSSFSNAYYTKIFLISSIDINSISVIIYFRHNLKITSPSGINVLICSIAALL
ncbi:hypothetical protein, partial [Clostridium saccharobutylicum]|uniref:hypothetical protein n=1 Tax=Clostridium saccharobutylicum TaxID=169679 RepID=UPI001A9A3F71